MSFSCSFSSCFSSCFSCSSICYSPCSSITCLSLVPSSAIRQAPCVFFVDGRHEGVSQAIHVCRITSVASPLSHHLSRLPHHVPQAHHLRASHTYVHAHTYVPARTYVPAHTYVCRDSCVLHMCVAHTCLQTYVSTDACRLAECEGFVGCLRDRCAQGLWDKWTLVAHSCGMCRDAFVLTLLWHTRTGTYLWHTVVADMVVGAQGID